MLSPDRMTRIAVEIIFVLLGGLVIWFGVHQRILFNRHIFTWPILGVALVLWGLWALKPRAGQVPGERWTRGLSLTLLGLLVLTIWKVPFAWVGWLLTAAGCILLLRGLVVSYFVVRSS